VKSLSISGNLSNFVTLKKLKKLSNQNLKSNTMAKVKGDIVINIERCKGCEVCVPACPNSVIALSKNVNGKGYHYAETVNEECIGCASCAIVCPDGVITVYKVKL
jgi:2-oxoglutarate ferredoxin oxidoreductase subunit delta